MQTMQTVFQRIARATSLDADERYAGDGETPTAPTPPLSSLAQAMTLPAALTAFHLPLVADVMTADLVAQIVVAHASERDDVDAPAPAPESDAIPDEVEPTPDDDIATQETQPITYHYPSESPVRVVRLS